jgi:Transposase DDE domain group 1
VRFSVGAPIDEPIRQAITALPAGAWYPAIEADGQVRDGAEVAELLYGYGANLPAGTRFLVRRERPHPGAQLSLFDTIEGYRHQVIATDSPLSDGPSTWIEARHRAHARVEDRIRTGKDSGIGHFPSREYAINQAWLEPAPAGIDLTCWMRMLLLDGDLALAEPKKLRYRLLHVAARITRSARRTRLRIAEHWPWAKQSATAFERLTHLPLVC